MTNYLPQDEIKVRDEKLKREHNYNSRGTKKSVPVIIESKYSSDIKELSKEDLKRKYIPMYINKQITSKEACNILDICNRTLSRLKNSYLKNGEKAFENKHKGKISTRKTPKDIEIKIINLYKNEYNEFPIVDFVKVLEEKYNIKISTPTVSRILKNEGLHSPTSDKYLGKSKESLGSDYFIIMDEFKKAISKETLTTLEEYGLIQICETAFLKAYLSLNNISKIKFNLSYRTSYSLFNDFVDKKELNIGTTWSYWNKNHDKFSYVYNKPTRYKLIQDIRELYYPMFKEIENYIKDFKTKKY